MLKLKKIIFVTVFYLFLKNYSTSVRFNGSSLLSLSSNCASITIMCGHCVLQNKEQHSPKVIHISCNRLYCRLALPEDAEEKAALQKKISGYLNKALGKKWKNLEKFDQFYGEGAGIEPEKLPMVVLLNYREEDDTPYLVYFKHGLIEEKV